MKNQPLLIEQKEGFIEKNQIYIYTFKLAHFWVSKLLNWDAQETYYGAEVYEDYETYSEK